MFRKQQKWSPPGQPAYIPTCKPKAKVDTALGGATAPKEVNHPRYGTSVTITAITKTSMKMCIASGARWFPKG